MVVEQEGAEEKEKRAVVVGGVVGEEREWMLVQLRVTELEVEERDWE